MPKKNFIILYGALSVCLISSCIQKRNEVKPLLISQQVFDTAIDGKKIQLYTLQNSSGCTAQVTNFGARWVSMWVPDKEGSWKDVVLGFKNIHGYLAAGEPYHGAVVGRICGRIDKGRFSLDGNEYTLSNNDLFGIPVKNHLHGGIKGFHVQVWEGKKFENEKGEQGVTFAYTSKDGEEGFPGNLKVEATYLLTDKNEMTIDYKAETDKPTIVNLTSHAFFNLNGEGQGNILNQLMKINADKYIESDKELIPTGELKNVNGTPLDYRAFAAMGKGINEEHDQIIKGKGYAAAMVVNGQEKGRIQEVAAAYSKESGIELQVFSDKPSVQIYNAWLFNGKDKGKSGRPYEFSGGFVLEPQGFPDAPNHTNFPEITLRPGENYHHTDIYRFSLIRN